MMGIFGTKKETERIRYAVVGLGYIAQAAVLPAFEHADENSELVALVSGDEEKLRALGEKYNVEELCTYEGYDSLLASGLIDAVYIALPNDMHADYAIRAAKRGIHVLCEKPMAPTEAECLNMIAACNDNKVRLMIAYRLHFEEANLSAIDIVHSGQIGDIRIFNSLFTMQVREPNIRIEEEHAGGPLYDIGIYCINAARYILQDEPLEVTAFTATGTDYRFREVEEMVSAVLRFPGDRLATFTASFGAADISSFRVVGTRGDLIVSPAFEYAEGLKHELTIDGKTSTQHFKKRDQFAPEIVHFSKCILDDDEPLPSGRQGLADIRIIEAINRSIRTGGPVELRPIEQDKRPEISYELRKPAPRQPRLVHATPASQH